MSDQDKNEKNTSKSGSGMQSQELAELQKQLLQFTEWQNERIKKLSAERRQRVVEGFEELCQEWAKRDFWNLKEAINLLLRDHPEDDGWGLGFEAVWELAKNCIGPGGSLRVVNPELKAWTRRGRAQKLLVKPVDLLDWARDKEISIPVELRNAVFGKQEKSSVLAANQSRAFDKRDRRRQIKQFVDEIYHLAGQADLDWGYGKGPIKGTKVQFKELFEARYRYEEGDKVSQATFDDDLKELGVRFPPGVKTTPENDLVRLLKGKLG